MYFSDLHLNNEKEFRTIYKRLQNQILEESPDLILNAGDFANVESKEVESQFLHISEGKIPYFYVRGNHDFYLSGLAPYADQKYTREMEDVVIVAGTMWTNFLNSEEERNNYELMLNDIRFIRNWGSTGALVEFLDFEAFLRRKLAEHKDKKIVVLTHHAPSKRSISPRFANSRCNGSFVNDLDSLIEDNPQIKLWVHGHVHQSFDYKIGECRVVCHPRGYPGEENYSKYQAKFVEI